MGGAASTTLPEASTVISEAEEVSTPGPAAGSETGGSGVTGAGDGSDTGAGTGAGSGARPGGGAVSGTEVGSGAGAGADAGPGATAGAGLGNPSRTVKATLARATAPGKSPPALAIWSATLVSIL